MRDIIWTLIIVWLIYRLVDIFKSSTTKRAYTHTGAQTGGHQQNTSSHTAPRPDKDIKKAIRKHLNNEGEYVDFEEIK